MAITKASAQTTVNSGVTAAAAATINQITTAPATATIVAGGGSLGGVTISNVAITDSTFANVLSGDTAVSSAGGFVRITGTGFKTAANVLLGSTALANTFVSATQINANIPATAAGTYQFTVFNTDGSGAIYSPGLLVSGPPSWTTTSYSAGSLTLDVQLLASGDAPLTYYIQPGSANPQNLAVNSAGYLSGTVSAEGAYTITVVVDDAQNQSTQADITVTISLTDAYFNRTTVALPADTTTWVTDASTNAYALTVNGDTRPIAFSPYNNNFSVKFDGSNDFISVPAGSDFSFGTGDFTIECFVNTTDNSLAPGGYSRSIMRIGDFDFYLRITQYHGGTDGALRVDGLSDGSTVVIKDGLWHHIALVRQSNTIRLWIDGIYQTSGSGATYSTNHTNADLNVIGGRSNPTTGYFNGYITNVRVVKGTAVYTGTSNFTVPTAPLTAIANTVLLTCAKNRFIDANTTPKTITVGDAPVISSWTPLIETDTTTASGYFDGLSDNIRKSGSGVLVANGDVTIECWMYPLSASITGIFDGGPSAVNIIRSYGTNKISKQGQEATGAAFTPIVNAWQHFAVTFSNGNIVTYINGVQSGTGTYTGGYDAGSNFDIGGINAGGDGNFNGYISNFRVVCALVYTGTFTPPTTPLTAIANTSLLTLQSRIGENNNRFIDQSSLNHLITRNGNATQGTFSPFSAQPGAWSSYYSGVADTNGTYFAANAAYSFGTGDFTVEAWVNIPPLSNTNGKIIVDSRPNTTNGSYWLFGFTNSGQLVGVTMTTGGATLISTSAIPTNQWVHVAFTRASGALNLWINGVSVASATGNADNISSDNLWIGRNAFSATATDTWFAGYMSNLRIVKGVAVYTGTFTPPTSPLEKTQSAGTNIAVITGSQTSLLFNQSNRFVDNSNTNATPGTLNTWPTIQPFSPFAPTAVYSAAAVGGSGYFDGTGDYIVTPANSVFSLPGDFTLECWIYSVATQAQYAGVLCNINTTDGFYFSFSNSSNNMGFSNYGTYFISSSSTPIVNNVWTHIALTRSGTTLRMFFNGEIVGTGTSAANFGSSVSGTTVGFNGVNHFFNGYVSNARIVKGTALYTANFTPPTAPLTNITNTSLLLNFTNAGIIDATGKNILETVNQAQLSTAVKKFGSASIVLDGVDDYVVMPYSPLFNLGTGAFTIEGWVYFNVLSGNRMIFDTYTSAALGGGYQLYWRSTGTSIALYGNGVVIAQSSFTGHATGTWYHIACTRDTAGNVRIFVNGTKYADTPYTTALNIATTARPALGIQVATLTNDLDGYVDDFRLTVGFARYTATFTPPTATFKLR